MLTRCCFFLSVVFVACVGDSPGGNGTQGQAGGPCYQNGTCNAGLTCAGGTCVANEDGGASDGSTPSDATSTDAQGDVDVDGAVDVQNDPNNCGTIGHVCSSNRCQGGDCVRRVFVSNGRAHGTFGGASGADTQCMGSAQGPGLKGTFYAWISTSTSSPQTHFTKGTAPYVLVDGTTEVAKDFAHLAGTTSSVALEHAIDHDENGGLIASGVVWTATQPDGTFSGGPDCSDFAATPTDPTAQTGDSSQVNTTWTESTTSTTCSTLAHFYCVEQ